MMEVLLAALIAASVAVCRVVVCAVRARNKRLLLAGMRGPRCDVPGGIGVSVLCSGVKDVVQVESLLSVGYARYEVVVALDARRYPEEFASLVARYRMIRVEWAATGEFPVEGVRSVGRSRKRCYRRLVLMDREQDTAAGDFDAAAEMATYDYLLPLHGGEYLLPGAVERLVAEVGGQPAGRVELVRTRLGIPAQLVARDAVAGSGGFAAWSPRKVPRARRRTLWEPLLLFPSSAHAVPREARFVLAALLAAAVVVSAAAGLWPLTASLLTAALVWAAAQYVVQLFSELPGTALQSLFPLGRSLHKIRERNFRIS